MPQALQAASTSYFILEQYVVVDYWLPATMIVCMQHWLKLPMKTSSPSTLCLATDAVTDAVTVGNPWRTAKRGICTTGTCNTCFASCNAHNAITPEVVRV